MGWIRNKPKPQATSSLKSVQSDLVGTKNGSTSHVEHAAFANDAVSTFACPTRLSESPSQNDDLPYISPEEVMSHRSSSTEISTTTREVKLWIVIDCIVYDCSQYVSGHPGGEQVMRSFQGEDCSWQFWRFHSKGVMDKWGQPLRVGRTQGVDNRFREPERWVGLGRVGSRDEAW